MIRITVKGRGRFPHDMLRYDQCYPERPLDTAQLEDDNRGNREVQLISPRRYATDDRWRSFGWVVTDTEVLS